METRDHNSILDAVEQGTAGSNSVPVDALKSQEEMSSFTRLVAAHQVRWDPLWAADRSQHLVT